MRIIMAGALLAGLALAACSNTSPDRFSDGRYGAGGPGSAAPGSETYGGLNSSSISTSALDPASPRYFSEKIGDRVLFAVNESTLGQDAKPVLEGQARWLKANPDYTAIIEGHADEQGTREYNLALGARRASSARDFLVSQGVADSRLRTLTYGKERPIEVCSTEACYAKNRRAVTVITAVGASS